MSVAADPLPIAAFRDHYAAAAKAATGVEAKVVDERTFSTRTVDCVNLQVNVDNAYEMYLRQPDALEPIIKHFVNILIHPMDHSATIDQLVIIVRPTDYLARSLGPDAKLDNFPASHPMAGDVSAFLAVDAPDRIRTITVSDLAAWKIDASTAWSTAERNIKARIGPLAFGRIEGDAVSASVMTAESGLAPSLLVQQEMCSVAAPAGLGGQVVLLYAKDAYLFALPSDRLMTARFWKTAKTAIAAGKSLSRTPITCRRGRWVTIDIP